MIFLSSICLLLALSSFSPVLAGFKYVDKTCDKYGGHATFDAAAAEALLAVNAAISAINPPRPGRVSRSLIAAVGLPRTDTDRDEVLKSLTGAYQKIAGALGANNNGIYVYCGDSVVWSDRKPDPNQPGCDQKFDPTLPNNGFTCGVPVESSENMGLKGYFYAPNGDKPWYQYSGIPNFSNLQPGQSFCGGVSWASTMAARDDQSGIMVYCEEALNPKPPYMDSNKNSEYWTTPDDIGANLEAHRGSLSLNLIHEFGHALGVADDQVVNGHKAYGYSGMVDLAHANTGKSSADNLAWKNCDTQALFATAMLMDKCEWYANTCQDPSKQS
ncbi:MAG: hypothetical protein M4579_005286 [Chaenotheca gracillima]|nr:MAG: hypothetical protein M4579_005286 [Chaenotheca gracillima]